MSFSEHLFIALGFGVIAGSIPGSTITMIFAEVIRVGFPRSLYVLLWAGMTEFLVGLSIVLAFSFFTPPEFIFHLFSLLGVLLLLTLALRVSGVRQITDQEKQLFTAGQVSQITFFNGVLWVMWLTVYTPLAFSFRADFIYGQFIFLGVLFVSWLVVSLFWAFLFSRFRFIFLRPRVVPIVFRIFALLLLIFALKILYGSLSFLINYFNV